MLNFFRKIRQQLLEQQQLKKYLIYAVGEIVLVVLGILIALKINGINTNKTNEKLEINYLTAIIGNISQDIQDLEQRLNKDSIHLDAQTQLLKAFTDDQIKNNEAQLKFAIHNSAIINYFNPQNTVFDEMKSSGKINLIKESELRYHLMDYYNHSNKVVASQEINNEYFLNQKDNSIDLFLDMNSLIESQLPKQWNAEIDSFDNSFFHKDVLDPEVVQFSRSISLMKAGVWINYKWKERLLTHATEIKTEIETYLASK